MNEFFVKRKQATISEICDVICNNNSFSKDLAQEVSLWLLTNKLPSEVSDGFIYTIAYKAYHLSGSEFRRKHIDKVLINSVEIIEFKTSEIAQNENDINEVINTLSHIEKKWVKEFLKRNCSVNLFSSHTGIDRGKVSERMKEIYKKIKSNEKH